MFLYVNIYDFIYDYIHEIILSHLYIYYIYIYKYTGCLTIVGTVFVGSYSGLN